MAKRKIIKIDEEKCTGCGKCIPNCPEGALQIIDGKARLVSDIFCDGLGACLGHCPEGAITTEEREAEPYDEKKTMENIMKAGKNTVLAHLKHLKDHGEMGYFCKAIDVLKEKDIDVDLDAGTIDGLKVEESEEIEETSDKEDISKETGDKEDHSEVKSDEVVEEISNKDDRLPCGCSGSQVMDFAEEKKENVEESGKRISQLKQWPVQLTLVPPDASFFHGKDVILVADCVGYSIADFHRDYLKDKSIAIACPKLDNQQEMYLQKLTALIDEAKINTLTVMMMEVPCCSGLLGLAQSAAENASRKIPIKSTIVSIKGDILCEEWV